MDFQAQYLQAMRDQAPDLFKRLSKSGQLERQAQLKASEANQLVNSLLEDAPKDGNGQPSLQARREAEDYMRAELLNFPAESSLEQDERGALLVGDRPLLPSDRTT